LDFILNGIISYISGDLKNYSEAVIDICAESDRTFRTYFYRFRNRIIKWISIIEDLLALILINNSWDRKPECKKKNLLTNWNNLSNLINLYCCSLEEFPLPAKIILKQKLYREYIFSILTWHNTGLGP